MKNKKGFTLVELLAVIVILALIMGIAVVSIGGVLDSAKKSTFKENAASMIDGVRKELLLQNKLDAGTYIFTKDILDKGGTDSPLGGTFVIADALSTASGGNCVGGTLITGGKLCKLASAPTCNQTATAYVTFDANRSATICLAAGSGNPYIKHVSEADLLDSSKDVITEN